MPQYDTSVPTSQFGTVAKSFTASEVWIIISVLLAVIGGVILFTAYFGKDREGTYTGNKKILYDFLNFRITLIQPIFKVLYFIIAIALTLGSFSLITTNFFMFVGVLVFGNLAVRFVFELLLLVLRSFDDISEINDKLKAPKNVKKDKVNETKEQ